MYVQSTIPSFQCNILYIVFRREKELDLGIKNFMTLSAMMAFKMLLTKWLWVIVLKKQLMILKLQDNNRIIIANFHIKDTLKL